MRRRVSLWPRRKRPLEAPSPFAAIRRCCYVGNKPTLKSRLICSREGASGDRGMDLGHPKSSTNANFFVQPATGRPAIYSDSMCSINVLRSLKVGLDLFERLAFRLWQKECHRQKIDHSECYKEEKHGRVAILSDDR